MLNHRQGQSPNRSIILKVVLPSRPIEINKRHQVPAVFGRCTTCAQAPVPDRPATALRAVAQQCSMSLLRWPRPHPKTPGRERL